MDMTCKLQECKSYKHDFNNPIKFEESIDLKDTKLLTSIHVYVTNCKIYIILQEFILVHCTCT